MIDSIYITDIKNAYICMFKINWYIVKNVQFTRQTEWLILSEMFRDIHKEKTFCRIGPKLVFFDMGLAFCLSARSSIFSIHMSSRGRETIRWSSHTHVKWRKEIRKRRLEKSHHYRSAGSCVEGSPGLPDVVFLYPKSQFG
jgi:hypothetical protein